MNWAAWLTTGLGMGRLPKAPGTFGTLLGLPLALLFHLFGPMGYMAATLVFSALAMALCEYEERQGAAHDRPEVVIDEVAGYLVAFTWLPITWQSFLGAFVAFRFFDILKPPPIRQVDQKIRGGIGVVADDLLAGVFANVILQLIYNKTAILGSQL